MTSTIRLRRGTAAAWVSANSILAAGEAGIETDTKKWKVGDGTTAWNSLAYFNVAAAPPSFATPSIALGTAAGAGAASTVIRSDSTIVAFDATDPSTQAFGDSAVVGVAAVAARRDHKHAMPATPTSVSGNAGTATALQTSRNIDGQAFNGTADITVIAPGAHAATTKATPVDADELPLVDSAASNVLKKLTWANLKATAKTYFDTLYTAIGATVGGDLTGTLPNPTIGAAKITSAALAPGSDIRQRVQSFVTNVLGESMPRYMVNTNGALLGSARLSSIAVPLLSGTACTNVVFMSATTALSAGTNWWFALYDASNNLIRQSTDQTNVGTWAANSAKALAVDSVPTTAGSRSGSTTVTLTIPTLSQALSALFTVGDSITVSNANVAAYNGTFTVASVSSTQITYVCGGSATDSLVAPFPTVQLAAAKRVYTTTAEGLFYAVVMVKGTVPTLACFTINQPSGTAAPLLAESGNTSLTGTAPSPKTGGTTSGLLPWAAIT